jgi:hypothetical protein
MRALFRFAITAAKMGGGCAAARVNMWRGVYYWGLVWEVETYEVPPLAVLDNGHSVGPGSDVGISSGLPG